MRKETTYIKLAHYSIMEYLVSDRIMQGPAARFSINSPLAHAHISAGCAAYLHDAGTELGPAPVSPDGLQLEEYPLFGYAARTLLHHFDKGFEDSSDKGQDPASARFLSYTLLTRLFDNEPAGSHAMCLADVETGDSGPVQRSRLDMNTIGSPLYYASKFGLCLNIERLLHHNGGTEDRVGWHGTPLNVACKEWNLDVVKQLIRHGIDVNGEGNYETPLTAAARRDSLEIIEFLLAHGANTMHNGLLPHTATDIDSTGALKDTEPYHAPRP